MSHRTEYSAKSTKGFGSTIIDLRGGLTRVRLSLLLANLDIKKRYRSSLFGFWWIVASHVLLVAGISAFLEGLSSPDLLGYAFHVSVGVATYGLLSSSIVEGGDVFQANKSWIDGSNLPYSLYFLRFSFRLYFSFTLFFIANVVFAWFLHGVSISWLVMPVLMFVLLVLSFSLSVVSALLKLFFPDAYFLVSSLMRFGFFLSPILWRYEDQSGLMRLLADLNPFTHAIELSRFAYGFGEVSLFGVGYFAAFSLLIPIVALCSFASTRNLIPYRV